MCMGASTHTETVGYNLTEMNRKIWSVQEMKGRALQEQATPIPFSGIFMYFHYQLIDWLIATSETSLQMLLHTHRAKYEDSWA